MMPAYQCSRCGAFGFSKPCAKCGKEGRGRAHGRAPWHRQRMAQGGAAAAVGG